MAAQHQCTVMHGCKIIEIIRHHDKLYGNQDADRLYGDAGNDTLGGGYGNDTLTGGDGKDTFLVNKGDAYDIITDATAEDVLQLGAGIAASNLTAKLSGNNLLLSIGSSQSVTLQNWSTTENHLAEVNLSDGTVLGLELDDANEVEIVLLYDQGA